MEEKRIALIKEGVVFNIVVANSAPEMATLFDCLAIEVTEATGQAYVGYGFANGQFDSPPPPPPDVISAVIPPEALAAQALAAEESNS
jgi:hypothetical protein